MRTVQHLFFWGIILFAGFNLYTNTLPHYFSQQKTLTPEILNSGGIYDITDTKGIFHGQEVTSYEVPAVKNLAYILGNNDGANKRIEVDLTNQRLYAYEGDRKVFDFLVSTGKWGRTPTGTFKIWHKTAATKMEGGSKALNTYYYLPNVPFTQFFAGGDIAASRGFGIHGTYWHNNFGHPMSHGCINMKTSEAEQLFYWTTPNLNGKRIVGSTEDNPGTTVIIYGTAPPS